MPPLLFTLFDRLNMNLRYFLETRPRLFLENQGKWVLIEEGRVVGVGDEEEDLLCRRESPAALILYVPRTLARPA